MKKFLKKAEGFTLVELIVVIAILGILTAVAVPAYSGYMAKAKEAGDTQVLSAANTAIAAALTQEQVELNKTNVEKYLSLEDENTAGTTPGCTVEVEAEDFADMAAGDEKTAAVAKADSIADAFEIYYGGAELKFDYYTGVTVLANGNLEGVAPVKAAG